MVYYYCTFTNNSAKCARRDEKGKKRKQRELVVTAELRAGNAIY